MSFSGRLSGSASNVNATESVVPISISSTSSWDLLWHHDHDSAAPKTEPPIRRTRPSAGLAEELVKCRAALEAKDKLMDQMKVERDAMLGAICRQLLELECGLRKKEKELASAILQRDKVIREQSYLIKVLGKKAGAKRSDIRQLCNEAKAKIPQVECITETKEEIVKIVDSSKELTSIVESCSENDSDSAIMLDDERLQHSSPELSSTLPRKVSRTTRIISRSVSDIRSVTILPDDGCLPVDEDQLSPTLSDEVFDDEPTLSGFDSAHYRGFLLRHGSYERYKSRSIRRNALEDQVKGVCTLPRTKTNDKTGVHLHISGGGDRYGSQGLGPQAYSTPGYRVQGLGPQAFSTSGYGAQRIPVIQSDSTSGETKTCGKNSSTVVMVNTDQETLHPGLIRAHTNHRRITKPRDVKNRSKSTKLQMASRTKSPPDGTTTTTNNNNMNTNNVNNNNNNVQHFVKKSGSVYCSIFLSSDDSYSFA